MRDVVNRSASVAARIRNWAKANGRTYQHALTRFATERFCARLAASEHASRLVLKGGNLFIVWLSGKDYRPTMDTDFSAGDRSWAQTQWRLRSPTSAT